MKKIFASWKKISGSSFVIFPASLPSQLKLDPCKLSGPLLLLESQLKELFFNLILCFLCQKQGLLIL